MGTRSVIDTFSDARDGTVAEQIRSWRAEGMSVDAITVQLRKLGLDITPKTVERWLRRQTVNGH